MKKMGITGDVNSLQRETREVWSGPRLIVSSLEWFERREERERSANNSFLLLNFLSGERGQVTGRETEEGNEGGLASDIATKDGRMDGWRPPSSERGKGGKAPSSSSHCLLSPASVKRRL